jgi:hypothetical protein
MQGTWHSQVHAQPAQLLFSVLVGSTCDEAAANALLRGLVGAVQGEARRQRLNFLEEDSIQHLDRICSETLNQWAKPGSDKLNSAFQKIDAVKGKMQSNLEQII